MLDDALREALSASREAWQAVDFDWDMDSDLKAELLERLDESLTALEEALRHAGIPVPQ